MGQGVKANKSRGGYSKAMPSDLRLAREAREAAEADPAVEAKRREERMLASLVGAREDFEWIAARKGWTLLGFDTCFDWWSAHVRPVADGLGLRPEPEFAKRVIALVEQEQAALPSRQRSSKKELAELVGASEWAARGRKETRQRRSAAGSDLDSAPPVIDSTFTEDTALSRLSDALAANGPTDDLDTEAGRANRGAILDAVEAAMADGGTEEAYSAHFAAVEDALRQAGFVAEQVDRVIGKYRPDAVSVPISVPVVEGLRAAIEETAVRLAGFTPCEKCRQPVKPTDVQGGHLRCRVCDPSSLHRAVVVDDEFTDDCVECISQAAAAERAAANETAADAGDPSTTSVPAAGSGDGSSLVAGPGLPQTAAEPVGTGLGSGELEERIEEQAAEPAACEACGGLIDADEAHSGNARCEDCDSDGDHIRVLMPDETWGPCRVCHPEERIGELPRTVLVHHADGGAAERAELQAYSDDGRTAKVVYEASDTGVWILVTKIEEIAEDSPAADLIEPSHAGVPAVGVEDSPTSREGDRSETDFPVVLGPDHPVATAVLPGIDHHTSAGVSDSGVAPESGTPTEGGIGADHSVEPVLEGGGLAPDPSSSSNPDHWAIDDGWSAVYDAFDGSDRRHLIVFFDNIDALCDRLDVDVVGPLLTEEEMVHIHKAGDRLAQIAELLEHWRTKQ